MLARLANRIRLLALAGVCVAVVAMPLGADAGVTGYDGSTGHAAKRTHVRAATARRAAVDHSDSATTAAKPAKRSREAGTKGHGRRHHAIHGPDYRPPHAEILIDENSGLVMHEVASDSPCHPASLTKIMTLYLLFEQLEAGKFKLDSMLPVSANAARQAPTKLGLKADQTLKVEDAIKAIVTKSANDAAVVVGEAVGGTESEFARLMTEKAAALGMTGTTYVNASGLPADAQLTTARDQAILARAINERFPRYYAYFATLTFQYHGREMHNHNSLLGRVDGVDGIKTGYTDASGYNLVSSVRRGERHIVAVVLGGTSGSARDTRMRQLIEEFIGHAATKRTIAPFVEAGGQADKRPAATEAAAPASAAGAAADAAAAAADTGTKSEQTSPADRTAVAKVPPVDEPARSAPMNSAGAAAMPPVVPLQ